MVFLVKNSTKKGAKIQNEYMFLLRCIMATSWIQNLYFSKDFGKIVFCRGRCGDAVAAAAAADGYMELVKPDGLRCGGKGNFLSRGKPS